MLVSKKVASQRLLVYRSLRACSLFGEHKYDPRKHVNNMRNLQNSFEDTYRWGEYPEQLFRQDWCMALNECVYKAPVITAAFNYLNEKYGTDITWENYNQHKNNSWAVYNINIVDEYDALNEVLARDCVFTESKLRPNVEQRMRREKGSELISGGYCKWEEVSIDEFFNKYSTLSWALVQDSNNWRSRQVLGPYSSAENIDLQKDELKGVDDLKRNYTENDNIFNRLLRWVHN